MVRVTYIQSDGKRIDTDLQLGISVMEGARLNDVDGIEAECGGACSCATCHVKIALEWVDVVGSPGELEGDMLDAAANVDTRSRLSCQIPVTPDLDGLTVEVAPS